MRALAQGQYQSQELLFYMEKPYEALSASVGGAMAAALLLLAMTQNGSRQCRHSRPTASHAK